MNPGSVLCARAVFRPLSGLLGLFVFIVSSPYTRVRCAVSRSRVSRALFLSGNKPFSPNAFASSFAAMGRGFTEDRLRSIAAAAVKAASKNFPDDAKRVLRDFELSCEYPCLPSRCLM